MCIYKVVRGLFTRIIIFNVICACKREYIIYYNNISQHWKTRKTSRPIPLFLCTIKYTWYYILLHKYIMHFFFYLPHKKKIVRFFYSLIINYEAPHNIGSIRFVAETATRVDEKCKSNRRYKNISYIDIIQHACIHATRVHREIFTYYAPTVNCHLIKKINSAV